MNVVLWKATMERALPVLLVAGRGWPFSNVAKGKRPSAVSVNYDATVNLFIYWVVFFLPCHEYFAGMNISHKVSQRVMFRDTIRRTHTSTGLLQLKNINVSWNKLFDTCSISFHRIMYISERFFVKTPCISTSRLLLKRSDCWCCISVVFDIFLQPVF